LSEERATELKAVGVVTGHSSRPTHDRKGMLRFPSVKFQTADGRTVEFQNEIGTNAPPKVGDEVTVYYDPERPEEAKLALGDTFKPTLKVLLVVGAIFLGAMAFFFLFFVAVIVWVSLS
jgi:hypothetical protein